MKSTSSTLYFVIVVLVMLILILEVENYDLLIHFNWLNLLGVSIEWKAIEEIGFRVHFKDDYIETLEKLCFELNEDLNK